MLNLRPFKYAKDQNTGRSRLDSVDHYTMVSRSELRSLVGPDGRTRQLCDDIGTIYLQHGQAYWPGGQEVTEIPDWFREEFEKLSTEARRGFVLPEAELKKGKAA